MSLSRSPENGPGFKLGKFGPMSKKKKMPEIRSAFSLGTSHENPRNVRSPPPPPGPAGPRSGPRLPGPRPAPKPPAPGFRGSLGGPGRPAPARPAPGARRRLARPRPAGGPGPAAPKSASGRFRSKRISRVASRGPGARPRRRPASRPRAPSKSRAQIRPGAPAGARRARASRTRARAGTPQARGGWGGGQTLGAGGPEGPNSMRRLAGKKNELVTLARKRTRV